MTGLVVSILLSWSFEYEILGHGFVAAIIAATAVQHQRPVNEGSGNMPAVAVSTTEAVQHVEGGSASSVVR